jgi:hypothetical protein
MYGCECIIFKSILNIVSNDAVAWAFIRLSYAYKYALYLV